MIYAPPDLPLDILYEDASLIFVNKPAGLLSVPGKPADQQDCLESRLRTAYPDSLLVHRLDMDTSGIMIFARTKKAQRHLGMQFERRYVKKTYIADVEGHPVEDGCVIELPLTSDWPNRPLQKVCFDTGKAAQTDWRVLERFEATTRVELTPRTGRSHQLRVHMLQLGHPILGDVFYGDAAGAERMHLHALTLSLVHPVEDEPISVTAPLPF